VDGTDVDARDGRGRAGRTCTYVDGRERRGRTGRKERMGRTCTVDERDGDGQNGTGGLDGRDGTDGMG
jgi:hypothetical protein